MLKSCCSTIFVVTAVTCTYSTLYQDANTTRHHGMSFSLFTAPTRRATVPKPSQSGTHITWRMMNFSLHATHSFLLTSILSFQQLRRTKASICAAHILPRLGLRNTCDMNKYRVEPHADFDGVVWKLTNLATIPQTLLRR